ncbi:MAG: serpin family protein [Ruminococcaceae bacterium]|nr:serpin family protein [Oscillospiraceae bacterium]
MLFRITSLLLCVMLLFTSCQVGQSIIDSNNESEVNAPMQRTAPFTEISYSNNDFSTVLTEFSDTIYKSVSEDNVKKENIIFSPLSVMYALALASNGAEGETLAEFEKLFGGINVDEMNEYLLTLTTELESSRDSKVVIGNSIWANSGLFTLSQDYQITAQKYYSAESRSLKFDGNAVKEINNWVNEKTDGMIKKAIDDLDPGLATALFNTVLFDGIWAKEYLESDIIDGIFHNYDGKATDVEFLYSKESGSYFEVNGGVGFSKAYKDGYSFTSVLPNGNIDDLLEKSSITEIIDASRGSIENVKVYIPKFEYEYSKSLNKILQGMGLNIAFTDKADFDKMSEVVPANIMISQIFQKAKIVLNEHGTKAAAVTGITYATCAMPVQPDKIIRLDKPFLYIIQDSNGNPLFIGTIYSLN